MDSVSKEVVEDLVARGLTYKDVSSHLQQVYPSLQRGLSERSVNNLFGNRIHCSLSRFLVVYSMATYHACWGSLIRFSMHMAEVAMDYGGSCHGNSNTSIICY